MPPRRPLERLAVSERLQKNDDADGVGPRRRRRRRLGGAGRGQRLCPPAGRSGLERRRPGGVAGRARPHQRPRHRWQHPRRAGRLPRRPTPHRWVP